MMYKVIDGRNIARYPDKHDDGVKITDSAGQTPSQGDDVTPPNVLKNVSETVLSLKVLGAHAGENFVELPIEKCHVVFHPERNEYVVTAYVENTSKKTMYMQCCCASPSGILGNGEVDFNIPGVIRQVVVKTNEEADRIKKNCTSSKSHSVAVNERTQDTLVVECPKVPAECSVVFKYTFKFQESMSWVTKMGSGPSREIAEFRALLPEINTSTLNMPFSFEVELPTGVNVVIPDSDVAEFISKMYSDSFILYVGNQGQAILNDGAFMKGILCVRLEREINDDEVLVNLSDIDMKEDTVFVQDSFSSGENSISSLEFTAPEPLSKQAAAVMNIEFNVDLSGSMYHKTNGNSECNRELAIRFLCEFLGLFQRQIWPSLKHKIANDIQISISWFTHEEGCLGSASFENENDIRELQRKLKETSISGGTMFKHFLSRLASSITDDPTLVVIFSDGGDFDPATCLSLARSLHENHGVEFLTFGTGAWLNQDLMTDLATKGCVLLQQLDQSFVQKLTTNITRALMSMNGSVQVQLMSPHSLLSIQKNGRGNDPVVCEEPSEEDATKSITKMYLTPGCSYKIAVHTPNPIALKNSLMCNDKYMTMNSKIVPNPIAMLCMVDDTLAWKPTKIVSPDACKKWGVQIALKAELNSQWTKRVVTFKFPNEFELKPITPNPLAPESKGLFNQPILQNPFVSHHSDDDDVPLYRSGGFRSLGSVQKPPQFRSLGDSSSNSGSAQFRSLGSAPNPKAPNPKTSNNNNNSGTPSPSDWFYREAPLSVAEFQIPLILETILSSFSNHGNKHGRDDSDSEDEASKLVKMAINKDSKVLRPSSALTPNVCARLFLRILAFKYDLVLPRLKDGTINIFESVAKIKSAMQIK